MNKIYIRIILPSVLSILLFIPTIFLFIIPHFQQNIMDGKRDMIKELTNSAWSILAKYENDEKSGLMSRDEAQNAAITQIQNIRYGNDNKDYFWITDLQIKMIMHPYRSDLKGKDLTNFADPNGKKVFAESVKKVKESEHGFVDYMWQLKDNPDVVVPKLSYVRIFKPWGWVIGTGIYLDDAEKETKALTNKLLWISLGITCFIAFLLLFISQQSLKFEKKRLLAEKELDESKEKYKTLFEASTEGLIMISEGKINFLNNIFCTISGYDYKELINFSLKDLISENNPPEIIETFSKNIILEGRYEVNLKKKITGFVDVLVTSSIAIFYNKTVSILLIKDITLDRNTMISDLNYQKLVNLLNLGFFRAKIDSGCKFIFANESAMRIFGFENFKEMSDANFFDTLTNSADKHVIRNSLATNGFVKNKILKIYKSKTQFAYITATIIVSDLENTNKFTCDAIVRDITMQEIEKIETTNLITELKASNFLIEQMVKEFITPFHSINSDSTIEDAVHFLYKRKINCLLISKNENEYIGVVTSRDIQKRVLSLDLHLENPVYLIMSSPIVYITENTTVVDAISLSEEKNIRHLVVKNELNEISGVLEIETIYKVLKDSLSSLITNIKKTESIEELKRCFIKLQLLIRPLIRSEISIKHLTNIISSFSDVVTKQIILLTIDEIGKPPVPFSFITLGSEGRKEETLFTDQDNAIIYADVAKENEKTVNDYFLRLSEKVCNALNTVGYAFCKGNIMAKNPRWCQPVSVWEKYFYDWVATPESQNLLEATIFFDFRNVYGDDAFTENLRNTVNRLCKDQPRFLYHLAFNTHNSNLHSGATIEKNSDNFDLKNAIGLLIMFTRTYSLQNNIRYTNTLERLNALKNNQIINNDSADEIIFMYNFLMKLRFRNQLDLIDANLPLSNVINTKNLIDIETTILKKIMTSMSVYQNKIAIDFRIST